MKYLFAILTVLLFTLAAQAAHADDITFIDQCGVSSSAHNETLIVTSDIQLTPPAPPCIEISHENVTLDCQGFVLSAQLGGLSLGIRIYDEAHYVTVRNCILTGYWWIGIGSAGGWGLIEHNELIDVGFGMTFSGYGNEIRHNKIMGGGWVGMDFSNSDNNFIHHNSVHDKQGGMFIRHSSSNDIFHNIIIRNSGVGILLSDESNSNSVIRNRSNLNGGTGILLRDSYENLVADNVANKNVIGIEETGEDLDNTYEDNVCKANETVDSDIAGACK